MEDHEMKDKVEFQELDDDGMVARAMAMIPEPGRVAILTREDLAQLLAVAWSCSQEDLAATVCTGNHEVLASLFVMALRSRRRFRDVLPMKELVREFGERVGRCHGEW